MDERLEPKFQAVKAELLYKEECITWGAVNVRLEDDGKEM